jgi:hypothetical protein
VPVDLDANNTEYVFEMQYLCNWVFFIC